jgi:hypothetical protein
MTHDRPGGLPCDTRLEWATNTTNVGQSTAHGSCQAATPAYDSPLGGVLWGATRGNFGPPVMPAAIAAHRVSFMNLIVHMALYKVHAADLSQTVYRLLS